MTMTHAEGQPVPQPETEPRPDMNAGQAHILAALALNNQQMLHADSRLLAGDNVREGLEANRNLNMDPLAGLTGESRANHYQGDNRPLSEKIERWINGDGTEENQGAQGWMNWAASDPQNGAIFVETMRSLGVTNAGDFFRDFLDAGPDGTPDAQVRQILRARLERFRDAFLNGCRPGPDQPVSMAMARQRLDIMRPLLRSFGADSIGDDGQYLTNLAADERVYDYIMAAARATQPDQQSTADAVSNNLDVSNDSRTRNSLIRLAHYAGHDSARTEAPPPPPPEHDPPPQRITVNTANGPAQIGIGDRLTSPRHGEGVVIGIDPSGHPQIRLSDDSVWTDTNGDWVRSVTTIVPAATLRPPGGERQEILRSSGVESFGHSDEGGRSSDEDSFFTPTQGFSSKEVGKEQLADILGISEDEIAGIEERVKELIVSGKIKSIDVVADGMGGLAAGEVASAIATYKFVGSIVDAIDNGLALNRETIEKAVGVAHVAVRNYNERAGTTLVASIIDKDGYAYTINVGDSRAYLEKADGSVIRLTTDQSEVERNNIPISQIIRSPADVGANVVTFSVGGADDNPRVQIFRSNDPLQKGDRIYLVCDGVWEGIDKASPVLSTIDAVTDRNEAYGTLFKAQLEGAPEDIEGRAKYLASKEVGRRSRDNVTAVVISASGLEASRLGEGAGEFDQFIARNITELRDRVDEALEEIQQDRDDDELQLDQGLEEIIDRVDEEALRRLAITRNDLKNIVAYFGDGQGRSLLKTITIIDQLDVTEGEEIAQADGRRMKLNWDPQLKRWVPPRGKFYQNDAEDMRAGELLLLIPKIEQVHRDERTRRIISLWVFAHEFTHSLIDINDFTQDAQGRPIQLEGSDQQTTTAQLLRETILRNFPQQALTYYTSKFYRNNDGSIPQEPDRFVQSAYEEICETATASILGFAPRPDVPSSTAIDDPFFDRQDFTEAVEDFLKAKPV